MTGKDLFDAIGGVKEKYIDEVTSEIARENETALEGESSTKGTGNRISHLLAWSIVAAEIVILLTVIVALNLRNRKADDPVQTPVGETNPTAMVTDSPVPGEEINSIGVRNRQLVCGENYAADIQADGTVRITTLPGIESIADLHFNKYQVDNWKDIVSLRSGFEMLYAVDKNGHLWSEGNTQDYVRSLIRETISDPEPYPVSIATWKIALPVVDDFIEENKLIDGEYFLPKRSGRNIFLKQGGELVEFVFEDSDVPVCRTLDENVVSFEGNFYLKEDGTARTYLDRKDIPAGMEGILNEKDICELAENAIGVFGLRKDGTVASYAKVRYSCGEIVGSWEGVCGITAEGSPGESCTAVIAAVHTDGTVSAVGVRETSKEIEEVKAWKDIVAVAVGDNGQFIAGKTTDGEILFAVLEGNPVLDELANCSPNELYEKSLTVATPKQREQLKAIRNDLYFGFWEEAYTRRIMTIMGLMSEDAPYLTVDDAKRLIEEMKAEGLLDDFCNNVYLIADRFNSVAAAPDMDGGSGFTIIKYAVDADHEKFIEIHSGGGIRYYDGEKSIYLYQFPGVFLLDNYADAWSDETIREKVYEVIQNYTFVPTVRSDFGYAPENQELYDRLAQIDGAAPYILRYVLERDNGFGGGDDAQCVAVAADLLGRSIGVDDAELPDGFRCGYEMGTPKYCAARLVAALAGK